MDRTEALIEREEARAWAAIAKFKPRFKGKKVLLITGGVKIVVGGRGFAGGGSRTGRHQRQEIDASEDKERIKELMGQDAHMIEDMTPREMYKMLKDAKADIMLSGGRSQFVALKATMPWLDINQERHHGYMGYIGMVELVEEIDKHALQSGVGAGAQARALGHGGRELAGEGAGRDRAGRGGACRRSGQGRGGAPRQGRVHVQGRSASARSRTPSAISA